MTWGNLLAFSPELWLLAAALIVLALAQVRLTIPALPGQLVALAGLVASAGTLISQRASTFDIYGAHTVDGYAVYFKLLLVGSTALIILMGFALGDRFGPHAASVPGFMLLATLGAMLMASATEMITAFVALELLSVNLLILAALAKRNPESGEVGLTYAISGVIGSAVLLYGLVLVYGLTGDTHLAAVGRGLAERAGTEPVLLLALVLVVAGFAVKLGAVPFHWWVPEVYRAPWPVAAFISVVPVAGVSALFLRVLLLTFGASRVSFGFLLAVLAAATMTVGNIAALMQTDIKRLLAYSSIAQVGYLLTAAAGGGQGGVAASLVFLLALGVTNLAAFGAVIAYTRAVQSDAISDFAGMYRRAPALALVMVLAFASLIGVPPTAGFFGKAFALLAAVNGGFAWLALLGVLNSALAAVSLLRVARVAIIDAPVVDQPAPATDWAMRLAVGVTTVAVVGLGAVAGPVLNFATNGAGPLAGR